ncbi:MAG: hypothetical protein R2685_16280 [Candidatus Nitrosocosmicus sp.]|nr:hypothetical protein [Candidatus Nitrosocosmicus sp.]
MDLGEAVDDSKDKNNLVILKRVKSIRQLRNSEKEWIRLCYKEAVLKGFIVVNDIQCYIASRTKIWIERSGIEYLKKSEEEENRKWFYHLAKDHFAYVAAYRKAIDEIELYKKELWKLYIDKRTSQSEKIQIKKELHSLTKTYTLLLRDLPFVHNLTNYYDMGFFNSNNKGQFRQKDNNDDDFATELKKEIEVNSKRELTRQERMESGLYLQEFDPEREDDSNCNPEEDEQNIRQDNHEENIDSNINSIQIVKPFKKITDKVDEEMRRQLSGETKPIEEMLKDKDFLQTMKSIRDLTNDLS